MKSELNHVLNYIEKNLHSNIKLSEIAELFHYSFSYLSRNFNRYVGMSFNEYVTRRRLSLIALEIRNKKKSMSYLADTFGYSSQKYFSTRFKDFFHITPTSYKKGKTFITLQPIREIKGDENRMINNMKELCFHIWSKSSDENTMLDVVAGLENAIVYSKHNSEVTMITYLTEGDYTNIYEVKLNLINGLYDVKSIFFIENQRHKVKALGKDDESSYVIFEDVNTHKKVKANFEEGHQPYVIFQTDLAKTSNETLLSTDDTFDMKAMYQEIDTLKEKLLELTNEVEVKEFCEKYEDLVLMRYFGSEFVFVKLTKQGKAFSLNSIYTHMIDKKAMSYHFFGSGASSKDIRIAKEGLLLNTYVADELYVKSYILGGDEIISAILLKFPSGMRGNGGWDFSSEF